MRPKGIDIVLMVGLLGACTDRRFEAFPVDNETKTILVLIQDSDGTVQAAESMNIGQPLLIERARNDDWIATALLYDAELDALGLTPGPLQIALPSEESSPLPRPNGILEQRLKNTNSWQPLANLPTRLEGVRLKTTLTDDRICAEEGGCFVNEDWGPICLVPCPDMTVPAEPVAPQEVNRPEFGPCRAGWRLSSDGAASICLPPSAVEPTCPTGTFQPLGQASCQPLGRTCATPWPPEDELRGTGEIWYVQPSSVGVGTRAAPFGTLAQAIAASAPGDVIALSTGVHSGEGMLLEGRTLAGACVAQTVLTGGLQVLGTEVTVQDLTLNGEGLLVQPDSSATVTGVAIDGTETAIDVTGGTLVLRAAKITATANALRVTNAGQLTLERVRVDAPGQTGLFATGMGTNVTASDLWIRLASRAAVQVTDGARTELRGVRLRGGGILGEGEQTNIFLSDGRLTNTSTQAISIQSGVFEAQRMSVAEAPLGLSARAAARISLADVHIARLSGRGLDLQDNATLVAERLHIHEVRDHAIYGDRAGEWTIEDLTVENVIEGSRTGIMTSRSDRVILSRAHFLGSMREAARLEETTGTLEDITTEAGLDRSIIFFKTLDAILRRASIAQTHADGINITQSGSFKLEDAHIVQPGLSGIYIDGAITEMDRVRIDQPNRVGLVGLRDERLQVRDLTVEGSVEDPIPSSVDDPDCNYRGVELALGTNGVFERFTITNGPCIGLQLRNAKAELSQGLIARHAVGAEFLSQQDVRMDRVRFEDNIVQILYLTY